MKTEIPIKIIKLDEDGFHLFVCIKVNGFSAYMLIDTGASKTAFDNTRVKRFLNKEKLEKQNHLSTGLGTSNMKSHLVNINRIILGKLEISNYKSVVIDLSHVNVAYRQIRKKPIDGILGSDILRKHKSVIDYGQCKLLLK